MSEFANISWPERDLPITVWIEQLPKIELHVHLEGAVPLPTLWELIKKYGGDPLAPTIEALAQRFIYRDFAHFIDTWVWKNQFIREYEDFVLIAEAFARGLVAQNICYAEVFFSPADFARHGLKPQPIAEAIRRGLDRVPTIKIMLIADLVRDFGPEQALVVLEQIKEVQKLGVIGIGLGGSEADFPPAPFQSVFARARQLGFHTTVHAGEAAGPASIWDAIHFLQPERIGHGTRAYEDPRLVDLIAERGIPLELCPISNMRTGVCSSIELHPARSYFEKNIPLSINTDDPQMFGTSLASEFWHLLHCLHFSAEELKTIILQSVEASWLAVTEKERLVKELKRSAPWVTVPPCAE